LDSYYKPGVNGTNQYHHRENNHFGNRSISFITSNSFVNAEKSNRLNASDGGFSTAFAKAILVSAKLTRLSVGIVASTTLFFSCPSMILIFPSPQLFRSRHKRRGALEIDTAA